MLPPLEDIAALCAIMTDNMIGIWWQSCITFERINFHDYFLACQTVIRVVAVGHSIHLSLWGGGGQTEQPAFLHAPCKDTPGKTLTTLKMSAMLSMWDSLLEIGWNFCRHGCCRLLNIGGWFKNVNSRCHSHRQMSNANSCGLLSTSLTLIQWAERSKYGKYIEPLGYGTTGVFSKNSNRPLCEIGWLMLRQTGEPK